MAWVQLAGGMRAWEVGEGPPVLVLQEIFGVNSHIRDVCQHIAHQGYRVLAPELFHRTAPGVKLGYDQPDLGRGVELKAKVKYEELMADLAVARAYLGAGPCAVIGFCFGGLSAAYASTTGDFALSVFCYGTGIPSPFGGGPSALSLGFKGRVIGIFGSEDKSIPPEHVEAIRQAGAEVHVFEAPHGFMCDQRAAFRPESAGRAWAILDEAFRAELR